MLGSLQVIQRKILQLQPCSQDCICWAYYSLTHPHNEVAPGNYTALPWHSTSKSQPQTSLRLALDSTHLKDKQQPTLVEASLFQHQGQPTVPMQQLFL